MAIDSNYSPRINYLRIFKGYLQRLFTGESRRLLLISISSLVGSGLISLGLRFIGGLIQGHFVGPEILGYYVKFTILPTYLAFLELGVFVSLARQYPYYIGMGDHDQAIEYARNALGWNNRLCALLFIVFIIPALWSAIQGDWMVALGWGTQAIIAPSSIYMSYLASTYRNSSEFVTWSRGSVFQSVASFVLLPLVMVWQFFGVCARNAVPIIISAVYVHWKRPLKIKASFNKGTLKKMIAFGAPLMVFGFVSTSLWDAITRSYILGMLDEKALGIYAFAGTICSVLRTVATSISQVFHPRIAQIYGSSGKSITATFRYSMKGSVAGMAAMLPLIALIYWMVDPFLTIFLPKYVESGPITLYLCWWGAIPVMDLPSQVLIVAKRTMEYGISVVAGIAAFLLYLGVYSLAGLKITLAGIVIAYVICKVARVFIANALAWRCARLEYKAH